MSTVIKYTSDGKKVAVVGKLNAQETIVQEIFVSNGLELPSGENFVVKSLHDAPAESWKQKDLRETEAKYDLRTKELKRNFEVSEARYKKAVALFDEKATFILKLVKDCSPEHFQILCDLISGRIKYIIKDSNYDPTIIPFDEFDQMDNYKELRLLSLFGRSNGDVTYAIGAYSDYSGGNTRFIPFVELDKAKEKLSELILSKSLSEGGIKEMSKWGLEIPKERLKEYYTNMIKSSTNNYDKDRQALAVRYQNIEAIQQQLNALA